MSARDKISLATDKACGVGNQSGLPVFVERERDLIELGLRRLVARDYRILAPGELDPATIERCAGVVDDFRKRHQYSDGYDTITGSGARSIAAAIRSLSPTEGE